MLVVESDEPQRESGSERKSGMYTIRLSELELAEAGYENDPTLRAKEPFPFSAATGTKNTAVVYSRWSRATGSGPTPTARKRYCCSLVGRRRFPWETNRVGSRRER
jgi:hypothetical protein